MLANGLLLSVSFFYLGLLFWLAYRSERLVSTPFFQRISPYIYALSLAVYCSAWTFYGSIGLAASSGLSFLTTYIGPLLAVPLWSIVLRKVLRISRVQGLTSLADFMAARYERRRTLGSLVTVLCLLSIVPYISIQLKAITQSLEVLRGSALEVYNPKSLVFFEDSAFYLTLGLALFVVLFSTRELHRFEKNRGLVTVVALESLIKLFTFLLVGGFICYGMFGGLGDIFAQAAQDIQLQSRFSLGVEPEARSSWFWHILLSFLAIFLLPRQFQVMVVENNDETHLRKTLWIFPAYLLLINFLVLPIALAGLLLLGNAPVEADTFLLRLPMLAENETMSLLAYLGGFSAATSMIIVSTTALSTMMSNHLFVPWLVRRARETVNLRLDYSGQILNYRRLSIFLVLLLAYFYYRAITDYYPIVSIGWVSFAAIAQLAPSFFGGIFWRSGNAKGAISGLIIGFLCWGFMLIVPSLAQVGVISGQVLHTGLFGISILHPWHLFGIQGLDPISHAAFWSLFFNSMTYVCVSVLTKQSAAERNQAEIFVDIFNLGQQYERNVLWKGIVYNPDLKSLLERFLGKENTNAFLKEHAENINFDSYEAAEKAFITRCETVLTSAVGATSARLLISSVMREKEKVHMNDVMQLLNESRTLMSSNRELREKTIALQKLSEDLKQSNQKLHEQDRIRNDFISTVTHELRTPITAIRAMSEILRENPELEPDEKQEFLDGVVREAERMTELVNEILDLERFERGKAQMQYVDFQVAKLCEDALRGTRELARNAGIRLELNLPSKIPPLKGDASRLGQVLRNLLVNSVLHSGQTQGTIRLKVRHTPNHWRFEVQDFGKGIEPKNHKVIFEKFHQIRDLEERKPRGSGLGLSICREIIEAHHGEIWVKSELGQGARFIFTLPIEPV